MTPVVRSFAGVCFMNPQQAEERLRGAPNEMQDKRVVRQREVSSMDTHVTIDMFRKKIAARSREPDEPSEVKRRRGFFDSGRTQVEHVYGSQTSDGKCLTRSRLGQESQAHGHRCVQESKVVDAGER